MNHSSEVFVEIIIIFKTNPYLRKIRSNIDHKSVER